MKRLPLHENWRLFDPRSKRWIKAVVPGNVHLDLLRAKLIPDPFWGSNEQDLGWIEAEDWKYASQFELPKELLDEDEVELVAEGLDTLASIRVNGRLVAKTENMFLGYRFGLKRLLKPGSNRVEILFSSHRPYVAKKKRDWQDWFSNNGGASSIRKEQCAFGWDWGPRLVSSGIHRPIRLEAWSGMRIQNLRVEQSHEAGRVGLKLVPSLAKNAPQGLSYRVTLSLQGRPVFKTASLEFQVPEPQLWWPNGLGAQPLYDVELELWQGGRRIASISKRIGLRRIELDRHKDRWGESFQFKVNGLPVFAKGANWIPAHALLPAADRTMLEGLLRSATDANMNMLRVWGGGVYESEDFYDLCDELGLMVWQDFMFACALYPGDRAFKKLVEVEAAYQAGRLAHRACLALWCGNNESEQDTARLTATRARIKAYEDIFYGILPKAVKQHDGATAYWPSSPHNPEGWRKGHNNEAGGDAHFWDVWHMRKPVKTYESKKFRFCSEFGMQSYSSPEVAASFCKPSEMNVFSKAMENHQKNQAGNQIILDYVSRLYRFPKDYAALAYLSQLNQAYCMKTGVEHFRRSMPRTMGALYWQLNDCWPVFSWSSLEFGGHWKALHHAAKAFFAPALVSGKVVGEEYPGPINELRSSVSAVEIHTVYDGKESQKASLSWELWHLDKGVVLRGGKPVSLRHGQSRRQRKLDLRAELKRHGASKLVLRLRLRSASGLLSENTVLLTAPRFLDLKRARIAVSAKKTAPCGFELSLRSPQFQHQVELNVPGLLKSSSLNFFDLYPREARNLRVELKKDLSLAEFKKRLDLRSLAGSY